jgi:hypothetical protein
VDFWFKKAGSEGRKYGPPTAVAMAEALRKFPRYKLD